MRNLMIILVLVAVTVACTQSPAPVKYSKRNMTYKSYVSPETRPLIPYNRAVTASDLP